MTDQMRVQKFIVQRIPLLLNSGSLISLAFVVAGAFIAIEGALKLWALYDALSAYFPLSLPAKSGEKILSSLPVITRNFVMLVSSICAVIIGVLWLITGVIEALQARGRSVTPSNFDDPALCAECLRTSEPRHWSSKPILFRALNFIWPKAQFMSPASYELLGKVFQALLGLMAAVLITAIVIHTLSIVPTLANKYFGAGFSLNIPSAAGLYYLFIVAAIVNLIIGMTLVPMKRMHFDRAGRELTISGHGAPHLFFALLEEGCRLLNARRLPENRPVRLESRDDPLTKGVLIESYPTLLTTMSRPMGYICLPLIIILFAMGFSRLIQFNIPVATMPWQDFLTNLLPLIIYEVVLAFALIMIGLHFSDWAERLLGICKFQSWAVFCKTNTPESEESTGAPKPSIRPLRLGGRSGDQVEWKRSHGVDTEFIDWAKEPDTSRTFDVQVFWAEVISESATPESPRFVNIIHRTSSLDATMVRVLQLPFKVRLQAQSVQPIVTTHRIQAQVPKKPSSKPPPAEAKTSSDSGADPV